MAPQSSAPSTPAKRGRGRPRMVITHQDLPPLLPRQVPRPEARREPPIQPRPRSLRERLEEPAVLSAPPQLNQALEAQRQPPVQQPHQERWQSPPLMPVQQPNDGGIARRENARVERRNTRSAGVGNQQHRVAPFEQAPPIRHRYPPIQPRLNPRRYVPEQLFEMLGVTYPLLSPQDVSGYRRRLQAIEDRQQQLPTPPLEQEEQWQHPPAPSPERFDPAPQVQQQIDQPLPLPLEPLNDLWQDLPLRELLLPAALPLFNHLLPQPAVPQVQQQPQPPLRQEAPPLPTPRPQDVLQAQRHMPILWQPNQWPEPEPPAAPHQQAFEQLLRNQVQNQQGPLPLLQQPNQVSPIVPQRSPFEQIVPQQPPVQPLQQPNPLSPILPLQNPFELAIVPQQPPAMQQQNPIINPFEVAIVPQQQPQQQQIVPLQQQVAPRQEPPVQEPAASDHRNTVRILQQQHHILRERERIRREQLEQLGVPAVLLRQPVQTPYETLWITWLNQSTEAERRDLLEFPPWAPADPRITEWVRRPNNRSYRVAG